MSGCDVTTHGQLREMTTARAKKKKVKGEEKLPLTPGMRSSIATQLGCSSLLTTSDSLVGNIDIGGDGTKPGSNHWRLLLLLLLPPLDDAASALNRACVDEFNRSGLVLGLLFICKKWAYFASTGNEITTNVPRVNVLDANAPSAISSADAKKSWRSQD